MYINPNVKGIKSAIRDLVPIAREVQKKRDVTFFNIGDPNKFDFDCPPSMIDGAVDALKNRKSHYSSSEGLAELREEIVKKEKKVQNLDVDPDSIIITYGVSEALQFLFQTISPGEFILPAPVYPPYTGIISGFGGSAKFYKMDPENNWEPDIESIKEQISKETRCISVINPNNPTGAMYSKESLNAIGDIANDNDILVTGDEIYDRITYEKEFVGLGQFCDKFVGLNGFSKVYFSPGWRVGYLHTNVKEIYDSVLKLARVRLCTNTPLQYGALEGLKGPHDFIDQNMKKLRERRDFAHKRLNELGLTAVKPEGAFYIFPKTPIIDDKKFVIDVLKNAGILFVHGSGFSFPGYMRMVYLAPVDIQEDAFSRLEEFMRREGYI